jgi:ankyrin repeat protein
MNISKVGCSVNPVENLNELNMQQLVHDHSELVLLFWEKKPPQVSCEQKSFHGRAILHMICKGEKSPHIYSALKCIYEDEYRRISTMISLGMDAQIAAAFQNVPICILCYFIDDPKVLNTIFYFKNHFLLDCLYHSTTTCRYLLSKLDEEKFLGLFEFFLDCIFFSELLVQQKQELVFCQVLENLMTCITLPAGRRSFLMTSEGVSLMHLAAKEGLLSVMKTLFNMGEADDFEYLIAADSNDMTPLHHAISNQQLDAIYYLLKRVSKEQRNFLITSLDPDGYSVLEYAAYLGFYDSIEKLLSVIDIIERKQLMDDGHPLACAKDKKTFEKLCSFANQKEWEQFLSSEDLDLMHLAVAHGSIDIIERLWMDVPDVSGRNRLLAINSQGMDLLHTASKFDQPQAIKKLFSLVSIAQQDQAETTCILAPTPVKWTSPIKKVDSLHSVETLEELDDWMQRNEYLHIQGCKRPTSDVKKSANLFDECEFSLLNMVSSEEDTEYLESTEASEEWSIRKEDREILWDNESKAIIKTVVEIKKRSYLYGFTPLDLVSSIEMVDCLHSIAKPEEWKLWMNSKQILDGKIPEAALKRIIEIANTQQKIQLMSDEPHRKNLVHIAARKGMLDLLEFFFKSSVEDDMMRNACLSRDATGGTVLHTAVMARQRGSVEKLLEIATPEQRVVLFSGNNSGHTPLHKAMRLALSNCIFIEIKQIINTLLKHAKPHEKDILFAGDNEGKTPLHVAIATESDLIQPIIKSKLEVQAKSSKAVKNLLIKSNEQQAQLLKPDNEGNTPLHSAVLENDIKMLSAIISTVNNSCYKQLFNTNRDGYAPIQLALIYKKPKAIECILYSVCSRSDFPVVNIDPFHLGIAHSLLKILQQQKYQQLHLLPPLLIQAVVKKIESTLKEPIVKWQDKNLTLSNIFEGEDLILSKVFEKMIHWKSEVSQTTPIDIDIHAAMQSFIVQIPLYALIAARQYWEDWPINDLLPFFRPEQRKVIVPLLTQEMLEAFLIKTDLSEWPDYIECATYKQKEGILEQQVWPPDYLDDWEVQRKEVSHKLTSGKDDEYRNTLKSIAHDAIENLDSGSIHQANVAVIWKSFSYREYAPSLLFKIEEAKKVFAANTLEAERAMRNWL